MVSASCTRIEGSGSPSGNLCGYGRIANGYAAHAGVAAQALPAAYRAASADACLTTLQDASDFLLNVLDGQDLQKPHWQVVIAALLEAAEECSNEAVQDATLELHRALSRDGLL